MTDQEPQEDRSDQNIKEEKPQIVQNRPSHMNQGNRAFRPGQQQSPSSGDDRDEERKND